VPICLATLLIWFQMKFRKEYEAFFDLNSLSLQANFVYSFFFPQVMLTGRHFVRDVFCKKCAVKLGWIYEFATDDSQRYKEGN